MILSDISVKRPVLASVFSMVIILFGLVSFMKLPLREYPDIDPPIVSVRTDYVGASAEVVETRVTQLIEDRLSGLEGIKTITSESEDGASRITIEFQISRDIDAAANDVRDRVSSILDDLPQEVDSPEIEKVDSSDDVIMWLNLTSDRMSILELTDYARRYLEDQFSTIPGVARVRIGGGLDYAMRIWIDRQQLVARQLTANDIENALRRENVEIPAGRVEGKNITFSARIQRTFLTEKDFDNLVIKRGDNGYLVRLKDVARVKKEAVENRVMFRGNTVPMIGIGIIKQSKANTITVADLAKEKAQKINTSLPEGMKILESYDTSVFIKKSIEEVYKTLALVMVLVVGVILVFLRDGRSTVIPAVTIPVSIMGTFIFLFAFGFSLNLITLLALVLMIGIVVDDAIVMLENISRRIDEGEPPLVAAFLGARQVGFAVVATSVVLASVFFPVSFLEGDVGKLFSEFSWTMIAAIIVSTLIALTLCPMLCSKVLGKKGPPSLKKEPVYVKAYRHALSWLLAKKKTLFLSVLVLLSAGYGLFHQIPQEYTPKEDRGAFFMFVNGPEGASFEYMQDYMTYLEKELMPYVESGEIQRLLVRAPRSFGNISEFNDGIIIVVLSDWDKRRNGFVIMEEIRQKFSTLSGVRVFPVMRQGFTSRTQKPLQFVLGGPNYDELAQWRDLLLKEINENNPGFIGLDYDYKETKPQIKVLIDTNRAGDLGVSQEDIGRTLETMLGSRRVTTFIDAGESYDVIIEGERDKQRTKEDIQNLYVRSSKTQALIPLANLVSFSEEGAPQSLNRHNRVRAITLEANLDPSLSLGQGLQHLENLVKSKLPEKAVVDYKGESLSFKESGDSVVFLLILSCLLAFLVLAAQFESYVHPLVIFFSLPSAFFGAMLGLYLFGQSLNIYTEVALVMMVGLTSKNGILIVEFINQLRDEGVSFKEAVLQASTMRLRPIMMTGATTLMSTLPLILSTGAGAETRISIGVAVFFGILCSILFTVFATPMAYFALGKNTGSPDETRKKLESALAK